MMRFVKRMLTIIVLSGYIAIISFPISARAEWPERPVKMIVTFPAGSANDAAARVFADALGKKWGKPVIVEDRPGAEGSIGVGAFVNAQDDHTLLYTVGGSITVAPLLLDKLPYDVDRDLEAIAATTSSPPCSQRRQLMTFRIDHRPEGNPARMGTSTPLPRHVFAAFLRNRTI